MTRKHPLGLWILAAICAFMALPSHSETFNRFTPATGVLVGNASTPTTTAATNANIISLWTGTCNASSFLRGDGACAAAGGGGSGTVTSVGLTVPTGLSVTGSPITTTGTLAISTTLNGLLRGTGSGFATAASSNVISLWSGTCDTTTYLRGDGSCVTPGGGGGGGTVTSVGLTMPSGFSVASSPVTTTGTLAVTTTLNGALAGNGSGFTTATNANIISLWTGTCNASSFLRGDGSCQAVGASSGANPTASIGLTANNGVASTYMRSDGSPALSQAIAPTWTAKHIFTNTGTFASAAFAASFVSADPAIQFYENDGALNNKNWALAVSSEQLAGYLMNDDGSGAGAWLQVNRTGVNVDTIDLAPASGSVRVNGVSVRDASVINSGTLAVARGGTGTTTSTGTGSVVLSASPTFTGTVAAAAVTVAGTSVRDAGILTSGTLAVARGGTGTTTSTGTGNVVLSASPTLTGTTTAATIAATAVTVGGSNVCRQNGTNCPSTSGALGAAFGGTGSDCTWNGGNALVTCIRSSAGVYVITPGTTPSTQAVCTANDGSTISGTPRVFSAIVNGSGTTTVRSYVGSTPTDGPFTVLCSP